MKKNSLKKEENIAVLLFLRFPGLLSENTARAFFIPHEARNVLNDAVDMRQHFLDELTDQRIALTGRIHLLINRNGGELPVEGTSGRYALERSDGLIRTSRVSPFFVNVRVVPSPPVGR